MWAIYAHGSIDMGLCCTSTSGPLFPGLEKLNVARSWKFDIIKFFTISSQKGLLAIENHSFITEVQVEPKLHCIHKNTIFYTENKLMF